MFFVFYELRKRLKINSIDMWKKLIFFALSISIFSNATENGLYTVVGPGTIRSNFKYNIAISVQKPGSENVKVKVGITGPSYNESKIVEIKPMTTENVEFNVPKLISGDYNLTAESVSGLEFKNSTRLNYADNKPTIFLQTDKATYKPGDLVQFRVLFLDENTRPAKIEQPISLLIEDGAQNLIKQLKDIKLTKGVYSGSFQLSEQPVLGNWLMKVAMDGENLETKSFEVAKYVLPKFEVSIDTARDIAISDGIIKATIRSKYTYGKSVKGKATVSIKPTYSFYGNTDDVLEAEKTIDVDGKGHVEFSLKDDFKMTNEKSYWPPLKILAIMEEELTSNKQNATATVVLHNERYRIEGIETPFQYHPGKTVMFKIVVKDLMGKPVQNIKNIAKLILEPPKHYFYRGIVLQDEQSTTTESPNEKSLEYESNLDEHGTATFEFKMPDTNTTFYSVKCQFLDTTAYLSSLSKYEKENETPQLLNIKQNTENPHLGKDVSIEIQSSQEIPYFVYIIVARGNIVKSEYVDVPEERKSYTIKFTPTFEMIPRAFLYIHYIVKNDLRFEEHVINFEKNFENKVSISAQPQAKPGEDVKLKIETDRDSFVGLLGVDQSVLLLKSGNDLKKDEIFESLNKFDTNTPWQNGYGRYPGRTSGLVTLTNAHYPFNDGTVRPLYTLQNTGVLYSTVEQAPGSIAAFGAGTSGGSQTVEQLKIRQEFSEIWIFDYNENADADGFTLTKKIPDTITSWVVTGFSLNPQTGFALTENPTKIQVFQPFFVSTNLPYSVKRGEVIAVPVIIFNYMEKALDAEVTMDNTDKDYEFTEATNEINESPIDEIKRTKRVSIPSNAGKSVSFMIRPKKGDISLKISAITPLAGDAIVQTLKVEPEGVTQYENRAIFINLNDKSEVNEKIVIDIPNEVVPDSEYIELSVVGDLLGPTIKNLDKLVRMPYGCGEQNMVNFVPNILVLQYLEAVKKPMPTLMEKAKKFMEVGYQRELTYKHDDGSYSAFGKLDKHGSTWLTAYVIRSFHQAAKYIDIDQKVIVEGLDFLASKQVENGSFSEFGELFDSAHQSTVGLNAFVLLTFLENSEYISKYQAHIDKSLKYLHDNVDKTDDQYTLAIVALALQKAKNQLVEKVLAKLQGVSKQDGDRKWWSKEKNKEKDSLYYWRPRSNDVEITAYILLALLEKETPENVLPIIKWLISQRNSNGGFVSTQDTVVGLQALIKFAEKTGSGNGEVNIDYTSSGGVESKGNIKVDSENSLLLQTHVLPQSTRQVDFTAKGKGASMLQVSYRYNLAEKDKKPSFQVTTNIKENTPPQTMIVEVCAEYIPPENDEKKVSNMAVLEVGLPSGYTAETESFDKIETVDRVKRTETKNSDSTVIVYIDSLSVGDTKCIPIEALKTHAVAKQKPAAVTLYDYYDTGRRATEYYEIKSSLCDICEGEDCGVGCKK